MRYFIRIRIRIRMWHGTSCHKWRFSLPLTMLQRSPYTIDMNTRTQSQSETAKSVPPTFLTINQFCKATRICRGTFYKWRASRAVRVIEVCSVVRMPVSEIERLTENPFNLT
jgi:hypothetical protein